MKQISGVDLLFLTKELQPLVNQRIETFYFENMIFYMRVYVRGVGHKYLTINMGKYIYLGDKKEDTDHPNPFVQFLRKYLRPSFIRSIEEIGIERIIKIQIEKKIGEDENAENGLKIGKYNLYLELFGTGNIILTNEKNEIMNSLTKRKFKDRTIMNKEVYLMPPKRELDIMNVDTEILDTEINKTDLSIVKFLAIIFGLGGKFAEYICTQLKVKFDEDPTKINQKDLIKELKKLLNLKPEAYTNEKNTDFYPINFNLENQVKVGSFNEALQKYFIQFKKQTDAREKQLDYELKKLNKRVSKQVESKEKVLRDYAKNNELGTKIFENYQTVDELLKSINKAGKEKGWESVEESIKNSPQLTKLIKKLNYKKDEIILEL
ncbi:MAG: fibronectin/fibrinogen-binding protein [Nanoarchaeales archaeon]|nr:fibronectin/fibrinogen-binding protein [Nanoarchaeales archaeon]